MDVAFAVVPFAFIACPAIGASLLKAGLARRGFSSRIYYFNIDFAAAIGDQLFTHISENLPTEAMAGEWMFADLAFPGELPPEDEYVRNVLSRIVTPEILPHILEARSHREEFVDRCARMLKDSGAPIIGFTTAFHQTSACLAIARRLKEMPDPPVICFGGPNCEGEMGMEMIRSFPWVDYVCTREGDAVFPEFVERLLRRGDASELPGFLRRGESTRLTYPAMVEDMDSLPIPDYDDYVEALKNSPLDGKIQREIQIEAARGCWWGAKHHCTFCGLNPDTMPYRSKSPDRVYRELKYLYQRYGAKRIDSVDNILDPRYIDSVFPRLADEGIKLEMFYEVKANLRRTQLAAMRRGGVISIQPGIESFSTEVLKLMDKGVTGPQNIQLLKWSEEVGIKPAWHILAGFPGEPPAEYEKMAELIPLLTHLEPPSGCRRIRLDRFSPLFNKAATSGVANVRPAPAYAYVFPPERCDLSRLAVFFDFDYEDGREVDTYISRVREEIDRWRKARFQRAGRPRLDARLQEDGSVHVKDTRECAVTAEHRIRGLDARLLAACDTAQSPAALEGVAGQDSEAIRCALERLLAARLLIRIDNRFLGLAVIRNRTADRLATEVDVQRIPVPTHSGPLLRVL